MRKILALLLSVVMLLGACAFAEEAAPAANSYTLSNVVVTYGDMTLDLSSVALELDVAEDGPSLLLHLDSEGESAAEIGVTKVDNLYVLHMDGANMEHKDFAMDPVVYMERSLQGGIDGLIEMLQGIDVHATAENLVSFFENPAPVIEEAVEEVEEAEAVEVEPSPTPEITFEGDAVSALLDCVTGPTAVTLDGSTGVPAGDYQETALYIDGAKLADILDMVRVNGEAAGLGDAIRESGAEVALNLAFYEGESANATDCSVTFAMDGESYSFSILAVNTVGEEGESTSFDIGCDANGEQIGLQFMLSNGQHMGEPFTPASVDLANAVVISDMCDEEAEAALSEAFDALRADAILPIAGPLMEVLMANVDLSALEAEMAAEATAE